MLPSHLRAKAVHEIHTVKVMCQNASACFHSCRFKKFYMCHTTLTHASSTEDTKVQVPAATALSPRPTSGHSRGHLGTRRDWGPLGTRQDYVVHSSLLLFTFTLTPILFCSVSVWGSSGIYHKEGGWSQRLQMLECSKGLRNCNGFSQVIPWYINQEM